MTWTHEQAVALCRLVESVAPQFDCHVALTGGLLYKDGPRKDCDILFYRIRQADKIREAGLLEALVGLGFVIKSGGPYGWVVKAEYDGKKVDMFFPENEGRDYADEPDVDSDQPKQPTPAFFASMEDMDDVEF